MPRPAHITYRWLALLCFALAGGLAACDDSGALPAAADLGAAAADLAAPGDLSSAKDLATAPGDLAPSDAATADLAAPADFAMPDLATPDLATPDLAVPDLAVPPDLAGPHDLASPHDLANGDALPCQGGYLNSNDPAACPLSCSPLVKSVTDQPAFHIPYCTPIQYPSNPPASGNHWPWPTWWGPHTNIVPREWWVHNLEHQGIVLLYNCPYPPTDGGQKIASYEEVGSCTSDAGFTYPQTAPAVDNCPNEIAQLVSFYNNHPQDNFYDMYFEVRIVVTQDPFLPTRFAAVAWDWILPMDQLDMNAIQCFINARYGRGPEDAP